MDAETLAALRASIRHWQENVKAPTPEKASVSAKDCALCRKFVFGREYHGRCFGCPVQARTGYEDCERTPFPAAESAFYDWYGGDDEHGRNAWRASAQAVLNFLVSLLPEGESP